MHSAFVALVLDIVQREGVEHPAFAGLHVDRFPIAGEQDAGVGNHRNVDAKVRPPIIMNVDMDGDHRSRGEPH